MIKFFRKIRYDLMEKNKTGKYFKYAIGEIILVVIGILIALSINNKNEQKKSEAKIDNILVGVLNELSRDIESSTNLILAYRKVDSLSSKVLNNEVTILDYQNDNTLSLSHLVIQHSTFETGNNSYNLLMNNVNDIPDKYNAIVSELNNLHTQIRPNLIRYNNIVADLNDRNITDFEENYSWFSELKENRKSDDAFHYMLTDYKYKNKVSRFRNEAFESHGHYIAQYRIQAIKIYKQISESLNKSYNSVNFISNDSKLKKFEGLYSNDSDRIFNVTVNTSDGELKVSDKKNVELTNLRILASEFIFFDYEFLSIVRFNKNSSSEIISMTIYLDGNFTEYIKSK